MKKIKLSFLIILLFSVNAFSQFSEGFENSLGPDATPSTNWTLGSGNWAVFDNGIGTQRWGINSAITTPVTVYQGANAAYITRDNIGQGNTSENYLATPPIQIPTNGELHFFTRMFTSGNQGTIYQIKIAPATASQTDPFAYSLVQQWTEDELIVPSTNFNIYTEKTVNLSAFEGQFVYVSFVKVYSQPTTSIDGDRWLIDNVGINSPCLAPTGLTFSAITVDGATLNWINPNGTGTTWQIEVVPASGTPTGIPTHTTSTLPFVLTGLLPNTTYKYYVRALCGTGFSSPWSTVSANFTTGTAPPICGGNFVDSGGVGGSYANNENSTTTICPINPGDQVTVTFTSFNTQSGSDLLKIYDGNDASAPLLATLSGTTLPPSYTSSAPSGCLTFVFTSNATTTAAGWVSNVTCAPAPTCSIPTSVTNSTVTSTSVSLSWTQPANPNTSVATAWQVLALPCGSAAPTAGSTGFVNASSNPFTLTGLSPTTCYDVYVRAVCSASDSSAWSRIATSFTTQVAPPICGGSFVDSGSTSANYSNNENTTTTICPTNLGDLVTVAFTTFSLESCCDSLRIYDGNSTAGTLLGTYTGTTLPPTYTSSATNGCLTFVFTSDSSVTQTGWIANITCAPAPTCSKPLTVTNSTVTSNSAIIAWTQPANPDTSVATAWQVLALPCGSPAPTAASTGFVTANSNPFTLTGLTPTTCYAVYVRAVCSVSDSSAWSALTTFTTQAAPPVCGGNFVDTGGTTGNYNNNANTTTTICPINAGDLVTVAFTAFSLESCCDSLRIYDGNSTAAPLLGTYTGTTLPPTYTSSSPGGCLTFVFTSDSSVTQTGWIANITCAPAPTCSKPLTVTNSTVTSNSAIIAWTQPANPDTSVATAWQVLALPCGSPAPTDASTGFVTANSNPFTLTGLTPTTCYAVYVRAVCSVTDSSAWSALTTFTTQAAPPVCGGNFVDTGGTTGNYNNNANTTTTICPINAGDLVTVAFTAFSLESCCDSLRIYDGNSTAGTLLGTYTGTTLPPTYTSSATNGCLTFVFTSDSSVTQTGWIANITCAPAPTCSKPLTVTNSTVTSNSAIIAWTQPANPDTSVATAWQVLALPCGSPAPTDASTGFVTANSNPFTLTGLTPTTCYAVYVRAVCSVTDSSAWSALTTFTTQAAPPVCGGNFVDTGGTTGNYNNNANTTTTICPINAGDLVTVAFTAFSLESCCDSLRIYDGDSTAAPLLGTYTGTTLPPTYTSSSPGGCLTFVFTSDSSVTQTGWIANITCAPAPTCSKPLTVTNSTVTSNSAIIAWTQPANPDTSVATAWQVLALPCGSPAPTVASTGFVTANSNPFTLTGLTPLTCYNVYVRAVCSISDSSAWSALTTFSTQIAPPVCGGNFLDSGILGNYANNSNLGTLICPSSPTDKVTVTFTSFDTEQNNDILRIYNGNSASAPLIGSYSGTNIPPSVTSSSPDGCLFFVFTSNATITQAGWSSNITCGPALSCPGPLGVTSTNVVTTTSQLSWIEAGSATSWQILVLPCGSPPPTNNSTGYITTTSNPYTVTGLTPNCCNQYYVRSVCSGSATSNWTPGYLNQLGSYVVWNAASDVTTLTGTFPGGTVNLSFNGTGNAVTLDSPATTATNLVVTGNNTFSTNGPASSPPSRSLTFTFSTPVIIDRYSMADIDLGTWDDSFNFVGVTFTSTSSTNVTATPTGAIATNSGGDNSAYASWFTSTTPVTSFSVNYLTTGGLTHAYLAYALKVFTPCPVPLVTLNVSVNSPTVCSGTPANVIATPSTPGTYNYAWTVPSGATNPGNVASFFTNVAGVYSVIITDPGSGATSSSTSGTVTINTPVDATFNAIPAICNGATAPSLPLTSIEGFTGTWSPSVVNNTQTTTYNFTPTAGQCANAGSITVTVNDLATPTFDTFGPYCSGATVPSLPTISNNTISGTWLPSNIDNTQTATYTFTPTIGQCASSSSVTVTVNNNITPTFISPAPICTGNTPPTLPLTSLNGISGTWSPSIVDNTQTATYTFTPNPGQCALTTSLSITVYQDCSFGSYASAVWLTNCENNDFFNTVGSGASIIGPVQNIFPNTDFGTYISNSNTFKLRGAEVKTFKSVTANVCSARLNYRIYPQAGTPGAFNVLDLPFFNECVGGSFPSGGPCNPRDQKWQEVLSDSESPVDLTAYPAGDYVLEVYYEITGDTNSTTQCDDTIIINNNGNNFIATYTLQNQPGYFASNPTTCNGTDGSILITNLAPNTQYDLSYLDESIPVNIVITSTNNGDYTISGLNAGNYNNVVLYANNCLIASGFILLVDPITTPTFDSVSPICNGDNLNALPTTSIEGIVGTWSPALDNTITTTYTFTPNSSGSSPINLIVNGDFTSGNTGFSSDYQFINNAGLNGVQKAYGIVTAANSWFQFFPACTGHLPTSGNMMVVDGSTTNAGNDKVWEQTVTVQPNTSYTFSYWLQTVATPNPAQIEVKINGTSIGIETAPTTNCQWTQVSYTWNSGTSTTAQIAIYDRIIIANGNDFSLDDISFTENITNQCATTATLTITVNQPIASTFDSISAICSGGIAPSLPATSNEGFTGTWSPSIVDNAQTLTYTFTPTAGQCATSGSVVVTVTPNTTPTFAIGTSITSCAGVSPQVLLPTTSQNGITGTWNPSTLDYSVVGTTVYTFTPTAGICATTTTLTAVINPNITPTFVQVAPICSGGQLNALPTTSGEGITGTWSPALNNLDTTIYTFIPTTGLCAVSTTMTIVVNPNVTPTFNAIAPLCTGEIPPSLPSSSIEGITGTWIPAVIDNTTSGTYGFTPTIGQCATAGSLAVTVQSAFDFELSGKCIEDNFIAEVTAVNNTIDLNTANFVWFNNENQSVGNNSNTFNVTGYLNSTEQIEQLPITFTVTVTNADGCYKTESITFDRIFCGIQKGISINNDGDNEFFDLTLLNVRHLSIFNRYGMKVYSKSQYINEWRGQSDKGDELPDGTYYYVIDFNDNLPAKTGWIYIIREN